MKNDKKEENEWIGSGQKPDLPQHYLMLVSRNFPPLRGGMERLNHQMLIELGRSYQTILVGPKGAGQYAESARVVETCGAAAYRFLVEASFKSVQLARRFLPKLILAGSGVNALPAWLAASAVGAKWGVYLHGLDIVVDSLIYQRVMLPIIRKADFWLVNSGATRDAAIKAGMDPNRIHLLHPGVTLPTKLPEGDEVINWRGGIGVESRPILLSVGRLTRRKGLCEFISKSLPTIVQEIPDVVLVVIGSEPVNALRKQSVGFDALKKVARAAGVEANLRILGGMDDQQLALAYSAAEVHVFPVLNVPGDMEGFGMVAVEAASYGVPTIAFASGGVVDAVRQGESGKLVPPGDYETFSQQVVELLRLKNKESLRASCQGFSKQFGWAQFGARLLQCSALRDAFLMRKDHELVAKFYDEAYYADLKKSVVPPSNHLIRLAKKLDISIGDKVLDVACGSGEWLRAVKAQGGEVAGIDISEKAIEVCRDTLPEGLFFSGPAETLPFSDEEFDVVTCLGSLEHFLDQTGALKEMVRVAKPGASILILVPNSGFLTYRLGLYRGTQQQAIKETIRSIQEWDALLEESGLVVQSRWKDLHVLSFRWIVRRPHFMIPIRLMQVLALVLWPLRFQYQIYHLCRVKNVC